MRPVRFATVVLGIVAAAVAVAGLVARPGARAAEPDAHATHDAAMERAIADWFAAHPVTGLVPGAVAGAAVDTFLATASPSLRFDTDGNLATSRDSVTIFVGESILWLLVNGAHTVTNGTPGQPGNGTLFNVPLDELHPTFTFTFDAAGRYPFFCSPHSSQMRGVVNVQDLTGIEPLGPGAGGGKVGFLAPPVPNPARTFVVARIALSRAGRARLDVLDARGRRVARPLDAWTEAGAYAVKWDREKEVPPGVYFLRLSLPGVTQSERVVVTD